MVRGQIRPYLVQEPLPSVAVPGGVHEQIEVPNYEGRIALSSGDVMHPVRHLFWSTCLAAAIGVVLETDATGGLVTMSLATAVAAVVAMG